MNIPADFFETIWYENEAGERAPVAYRPDAEPDPPPIGFDYMVSQFPNVVVTSHLKLIRDDKGRVERSEHIADGSSSFNENIVMRLAQSGKWSLSQAIILASQSCERCMNAFAHSVDPTDGYAEDSDKYRESRTRCRLCEPS